MCGPHLWVGTLNVRRTRTRRPNNCVDLRQRRTHGTRAPRRPSSQLDAKAIILVHSSTRKPSSSFTARRESHHPRSQLDAKAIILIRVKPCAAHAIRHAANVVTPSARILYELDEIVHVTRAIVLDALPDKEGGVMRPS